MADCDEDTHDDGSARKPQPDGITQAEVEGDAPQQQTERDTDEDRHHVGLFEMFHLIAQFVDDLFHTVLRAHHGDAVADAQHEFGRGQELEVGTLHAAHRHAEAVT